MEWRVGEVRIQLAVQGWFRLDGGILFGGIPKEEWQHFDIGTGPLQDENNGVSIPVNCFLITAPDGERILVDTSFGNVSRWKKETQLFFRMQNSINRFDGRGGSLLPQPNLVIPTHLHFDHAGGCVHMDDNKIIPAFLGATYVFHEDEIEHALRIHPKTRSSYRRETIDGIRFLLDTYGNKVKLLTEDRYEIREGITLIRTRGHTPGHLSVKITSQGQTAFIPGALMPTRCHTLIACGVGNDTHALEAADYKMKYLKQAALGGWMLFLEHDPAVAGKVIQTGKDKYQFEPVE